jgi:hypothetical protein
VKIEPSIFDETDQAAEDAADAEGLADAGRLVSHDDVAAWLDTWGTPDFKPAPAASRVFPCIAGGACEKAGRTPAAAASSAPLSR